MATKIDEPITNKAWVQVVDQAEQMQGGGERQLVLAFKGETQKIANSCSQLYQGQSVIEVQGVLRSQFGGIDDGGMGISWRAPTNWNWVLAAFDVMQLEAGQYCVLKVIFTASDVTYDGNPFTKVREDSVTLNWQTYSVSPYRYCNEKEHDDYIVSPDGTVDPQQVTSQSPKSSIRRHIEMAFTQNAQNSENNPYRWQQQGNTLQLTKAEKLIMNKVAAGVNPVFHYPVVQHTRVVESNISTLTSITPDVTTGIDVIAALPSSISARIQTSLEPWTNLSGSFIYCGQAMRYTERTVKITGGADQQVYTYTFVDTFEGALKPDKNFYNVPGASEPDDRWEFGVGPQPDNEDF